jgi:aryl-alcohol dehydrogenase-like predicted oxidoreductase
MVIYLQDGNLFTLQVRYIGVSNETSWGVCQFHAAAKAHGLPKVQTIQNSYSLVYRGAFETDLAETCASHNANVALLVCLLEV